MTRRVEHNEGKQEGTYRLSELAAASGASRDTIKYYLREQLLPPAEKPRANLSLYQDSHLKLIELIRKFQEQTKLSLQDVTAVFQAAKYNTNAIEIELLSARYAVGDDDTIVPIKSAPPSSRNLNFPDEFLRDLAAASLLPYVEETKQSHNQDQDQLAGLLWAAHKAGVPLSFFETAREKLSELADLEVKTLIAIKRPDVNFDDMVQNITDVNRIINRWMVTEKNWQIRNHFQRVMDNSDHAISVLLETIYQPSTLFRERHGVDQMLAKLTVDLDASGHCLERSHELCFACLLLGEYEQAITIGQAALAKTPGESITTAVLALAHGLQDNVGLAFEYGSQLEGSHDRHPVILQARMLSSLLKASKHSGVADTAELMKNAGEIFLDLLHGPSVDEPEAVLTLARANIAFPDFANSRPQAINALRALLRSLEHDSPTLPRLPRSEINKSLVVIYRVSAQYYLGLLLTMDSEYEKAARFFEQVVQLDPVSNFGKNAYLQLG